METLCTIIATFDPQHAYIETCTSLKDAIAKADDLKTNSHYKQVRVYAETNGGTTLTLIYAPK